MSLEFSIKKSTELSIIDIQKILSAWSRDEWMNFSRDEFIQHFQNSIFYLLYEGSLLVALVRLNNDFQFQISERVYDMGEMAGLVSIIPGKGYGKLLLSFFREDLIKKNIECIGFCFMYNRGFYEKCGIEVLPGKAKYFKEKINEVWVESEDDDVININLKNESLEVINSLGSAGKENIFANVIISSENTSKPTSCKLQN